MYCSKCGRKIADDSSFCPGCGAFQEVGKADRDQRDVVSKPAGPGPKWGVVLCVLLGIVVAGVVLKFTMTPKLEKRLVGTWYDDREVVMLVLYEDGTGTAKGNYGTGTWVVVNHDTLKYTGFYGETIAVKAELKDEVLYLTGDTYPIFKSNELILHQKG